MYSNSERQHSYTDEIVIIRFPKVSTSNSLEAKVNGAAADRDDSAEVVILAADGLGIASSTRSDADNADGGASDTDGDPNTTQDDAQKTEESRNTGVAGRLNAIATLYGASVALAGGGSIVGSSKDGEGGNDEGFGVHVGCLGCEWVI